MTSTHDVLMNVPAGVSEAASRIYRDAIVIDGHNDMATRVLEDDYDPDIRHLPGFEPTQGHIDLPRVIESGVTALWMAAFVHAKYTHQQPDGSFMRAVRTIDVVRSWVERHPESLRLATKASEVIQAKADGCVALLLGVEGGHAIEGSLARLKLLYDGGVRYLTLTWNNGNDWAGSSVGMDGTRTGGLTEFGRRVILEMNKLGMIVDVSHVSDATLLDVLETSTAPIIASHSSARAIADHPRNLTDEQLVAVASSGGVINVNFYSRFLDNAFMAAARALDTDRPSADGPQLPRVPLSVLIDHIDHVAKVAGIDHVGIGSDFDGISAIPDGMEDITALPRIAQGLLDRGYSAGDIKQVLGGNMLRVMQAVL